MAREPRPSVERTDPVPEVAVPGTALQVAQGPVDPVVIGAAAVPIEPGGPGVGAARTAELAETVVSRPLTGTAEVDLGLRPEHGPLDAQKRAELGAAWGDRLSYAAPLDAQERVELETLRRLAVPRGAVVDAAQVPGVRMAQAAATIKQDGRAYLTGEWLPVTFAAYADLQAIGAIVATSWHDLEPVGVG